MAKKTIRIEFVGEDMEEIIRKVIAFLNMFKGINLAESESYDQRGKSGLAGKPAK